MDFTALLASFGVGSIITTLAQWYFTRSFAIATRKYDERKEAYIGLLEAWDRQEVSGPDTETLYDVGHWHLRAQLVASSTVFKLLEEWKSAQPGSPERIKATDNLRSAMREDLRAIA